jgi:hypothetical protein
MVLENYQLPQSQVQRNINTYMQMLFDSGGYEPPNKYAQIRLMVQKVLATNDAI